MKITKVQQTKINLLDAAKVVLLENGYQNLTTRAVASVAATPMSQIQYHFGSKDKMILALFDYMNVQLLERHSQMYSDETHSFSSQWEKACDYLEEDFESGYVRILQELIAVGWSNPEVGNMIRNGLLGWNKVLINITQKAECKLGPFPLMAVDEIVALISALFIGAEAMILLGLEQQNIPFRKALRSIGKILEKFENQH